MSNTVPADSSGDNGLNQLPTDDIRPRFAAWPFLNTFFRSDTPILPAKHYDGLDQCELPFLRLPEDEAKALLLERGQPFCAEGQVKAWLNHTLTESELGATGPYVIRRSDFLGCSGPVQYFSEATGPIAELSLRRFWSLEKIGETPKFEPSQLIARDFENDEQGVTNDPQCSLADDWQFDRIEKLANRKQGHQFDGLQFTSYQHRIAKGAYDLEDALLEVHPSVPASATGIFWRSYEVHRHLCILVRRLMKYAVALQADGSSEGRFGDPPDAYGCAQTQISNFALVVASESPTAASSTRHEGTGDTKGLARPEPAAPKKDGLPAETPEIHGGLGPCNAESIIARAERRQGIVNPVLQRKGWKRGRLATEAGLGKNSVYEYLNGTRAKITAENRKAIAEVLDLRDEQLPD